MGETCLRAFDVATTSAMEKIADDDHRGQRGRVEVGKKERIAGGLAGDILSAGRSRAEQGGGHRRTEVPSGWVDRVRKRLVDSSLREEHDVMISTVWEEPSVRQRRFVAGVIVLALLTATLAAADLQPQTVAAFDRYVRATEAQMVPEPFLRVDGLSDVDRRAALAKLTRGEVYIGRLSTREAGKAIDVPDGLIHHWLGVVFVPGATLGQAVDLMQDYDRHAEIFKPAIARSRLVSRDGDVFRVELRFSMKKVITVVVNTENEARFTRLGSDRAQSRIYSLRIAEVADPGTPQERERPVGRDGGYLWRLYLLEVS
jgi:hypothetical protein